MQDLQLRFYFWLTLCAVVVGSGAVYAWSVGVPFYSADGVAMYYSAYALGVEGRLNVPSIEISQIVEGKDGKYYGKYDIGMPALAAHVADYADGVGKAAQANRFAVGSIFVMIVPVSSMALAMGNLFLIALFQSRSFRIAILITMIAALGTSAWPYARLFFAEAITTLCITASAAWLLCRPKYVSVSLLGVGLLMGISVMTRAHTIIFALGLYAFILTDDRHPKIVPTLFLLAIGPLVAIGVLALHNWLRFETILPSAYNGERFETFPLVGVVGLLVSPGKSVFLHAPPLLLSVILYPRYRRYYPRAARLLVLLTVFALVFYGSWWAWHGGWVWGPRFLVPLMPLWCLPWIALPVNRQWVIMATLIFLVSVGVQVVGTFTNVNPAYSAAFAMVNDPDDAQRYAMVHYDIVQTPLYVGVEHVLNSRFEPQAIYELQSTDLMADWVYGVPQTVERLLLVSGVWLVWMLWRNPILANQSSQNNRK